ncbi:P80 family lipoprotein [Mycoplasmopsis caviae]|uniref:P80 family lipoprotein n=1 Tax=Mycoplasmopsis caviae TaxID=55603 RepID=A0A3P8KN04_9BACT|nr:P80 family lipoprotein [Mycoplasmopsis caviae]UUD34943.1 P80 family lipoprotein [Mycoplasmopsis caviae]VDR42228.1 Uncharacterized lipoprotein MPN_097 precursor [Mycoplasmopsis caviae]
MNNKFKKIALTIAGASMAAVPFISGSCGGGKTKFDVNTNKVRLDVTFARGKQQWNALKWVIDAYNDKEGRNKDFYEKHKEDFAEVDLHNAGSGYSQGHKSISTALSNKDQSNMPQLTLNYGGTVATAIEYGMNLDLGKTANDDYGVERESVHESFMKINDSISGVKQGEVNYLPFLKSTVNFGINGPVFKYILKSLKEAGLTVDNELETKFNLSTNTWDEDIKVVGDDLHFGKAIDKEEIKKIFDNKAISKNILTNGKDLFEFATKAQKCFEKSKDPKTTPVHVLGLDDFAGAWHYLAFSKANGNEEALPIKKIVDATTGVPTISYENAIKTSGAAYENLEPIFKTVMEAVKSGGLKLYGDGQYASSDQTFHKIGGSFGSSAGWHFNYIKKVSNSYSLKLTKDNKTTLITEKELQLVNYGTAKDKNFESLFSVEQSNASKFEGETDKSKPTKTYTSPILKSVDVGKADNYSLILDSSYDSKYDEIVNTLKTQSSSPKRYLIKLESQNEKVALLKDSTFSDKIKYLGQAKDKSGTKQYDLFVTDFDVTTATITINANISINSLGASGQLEKTELIGLMSPTKWDENSKETSFLQGPNLIGFHSNEKINKSTRLFVKWLFDTSKNYKFQKSEDNKFDATKAETYTETTTLKFFTKNSGYLVPFKGFESTEYKDLFEDGNQYHTSMFEQLKKVVGTSSNATLYEEPISPFADLYRNEVKSAFIALATTLKNNPAHDVSYKNDFISSIESKIQTFN